jgi:hypothetical protein
MLTRTELLHVLTILGDSYPGWADKRSATLPDTWLAVLGHVPLERLILAATAHMQCSSWPPTPADLLARAEPAQAVQHDAAWSMLKLASQHVGPYSSDERLAQVTKACEGKDPVAMATLRDLGGFSFFWQMLTEDVSYARKRFSDGYVAHAARRRFEAEENRALDTLRASGPRLGAGPGRPRLVESEPQRPVWEIKP